MLFLDAATRLLSRRIHRRSCLGAEQSLPLEQHAAEPSQRTFSLFPILAQWQQAQDRAVSALKEQPGLWWAGGRRTPCASACLLRLWHRSCWGSGLWCSLNVNSTRILHFKVIVTLLNPARSNHTTSYPLDNEQRLFSFLVPQWNSSFLPARDWGCD